MDDYISHEHGWAEEARPSPEHLEAHLATMVAPVEEQWRIDILSALVAEGKIPAEPARAAVARKDWKAVQRLIRTATTTRELR